MTIFSLMKRDHEYTGIGGYLNSSFRSDATDSLLLQACEALKLDYADLFLWVNSRYARHFMDSEPDTVELFVKELKGAVSILREEVGPK